MLITSTGTVRYLTRSFTENLPSATIGRTALSVTCTACLCSYGPAWLCPSISVILLSLSLGSFLPHRVPTVCRPAEIRSRRRCYCCRLPHTSKQAQQQPAEHHSAAAGGRLGDRRHHGRRCFFTTHPPFKSKIISGEFFDASTAHAEHAHAFL